MQVRVRPSFYSSIKEVANRLNISACAFVRLSVATQIQREKEKFQAGNLSSIADNFPVEAGK